MRSKDIFHFSWRNLSLRPKRTALTVLGIVIGISVFVFFGSLSEGIRQAALLETTKSYADTQIVVRPDYFRTGIFEVLPGKKVGLSETNIARFKELPGVEAVYPQMTLKFPTSARIQMMGYSFETDAPIFGIDPEVVKDLPEMYQAFAEDHDYIPLILNSHLLDIYNSSIAESNNLPPLTESALIGYDLELLLGYSTFMQSALNQSHKSVQGRIVGFSERVPMMGISIPIQEATAFMAEVQNGVGEEGMNYHTVYIVADTMENIESISAAVEAMGFSTESAIKMVRQINSILNYFFLIFGVLTLIILVVAVGSIANTISMSVLSRVREIGILRACGATRRDVSLIFFTESMLMGLFGALSGIVMGTIGALLCDAYLLSIVPDISYKPDSFFSFPGWLFGVAVILALGISGFGGYFPSRRAAKMDPIEALFYG